MTLGYFLHCLWAVWEGNGRLSSPGFPTCAGCSLPFIIPISPSPATSSSCTPVSPQLCWCCRGLTLSWPSPCAVVAKLSSHPVWELKKQQWAAFSTAGHKMLLSGCVHVLISLPQDVCRGPGEAPRVWECSGLSRVTLWVPPAKHRRCKALSIAGYGGV